MMNNGKKEASPETIQRLIDNTEKGLTQIELLSPLVLETRQTLEGALKKKGNNNAIQVLLLCVLDTLLAENEVIYDLSASLDALLKANDDYTKRYYMQSMNLCFAESCRVFVGQKGDINGLLQRLERQCGQSNLVGCQLLINHIIDDIQTFQKEYANKKLRDITRHYDHPMKMYEEVKKLDNIDFFAKGASQLMALRLEISVVSSYLLNLLAPKNRVSPRNVSPQKNGVVQIVNEVVIEKFINKDFKGELEKILRRGQQTVDDCYRQYNSCRKAAALLEERGSNVPDVFEKMESLIFLRMEALFLRYDVACSVWGYINASSEKERSQNLRLIHITKQAALTHIFGYTENTKKNSLWSKIKSIEEAGTERLDTEGIEKTLEELTQDLAADNQKSRMYAHYRYKENFYIPDRLEAFGKMLHATELEDSLKLLNVCKSLDSYTYELLRCIHDNQEQERKKQYDEWMGKIDQLVAPSGKDKKIKDALKPLRDLVELMYGDKKEQMPCADA
jgi:hypothetical protein